METTKTITSEPTDTDSAAKTCLNCGATVDGAYCSHCGQPASVGRLTMKTALIDNTLNAFRVTGPVWSTAVQLLFRPWDVIRGYIQGRRASYVQPVRFIIIMLFILVGLHFLFPEEEAASSDYFNTSGGMAMRLWNAFRAFCHDSQLTQDLIDSVIFAPVVILLYRPWGSRRFNIAEYSTAYLYLCGASLVLDVAMMPLTIISEALEKWVDTDAIQYSVIGFGLIALLNLLWGIYVLNGMIRRAFHIEQRWKRVGMMIVNLLVILAMAILNRLILYGL